MQSVAKESLFFYMCALLERYEHVKKVLIEGVIFAT